MNIRRDARDQILGYFDGLLVIAVFLAVGWLAYSAVTGIWGLIR